MSPTYRSESQVIAAAKEYKWEIVPAGDPRNMWDCPAWGVKKGRYKAVIWERRNGGFQAITLTFPKYSGSNCEYYGTMCRGKLDRLLTFMADPEFYVEHLSK